MMLWRFRCVSDFGPKNCSDEFDVCFSSFKMLKKRNNLNKRCASFVRSLFQFVFVTDSNLSPIYDSY